MNPSPGRGMPLVTFLCVILALIAGQAQAATTSGILGGDEVWSGTVVLTGDVTVPPGRTLTIEPGSRVLFAPGADDRSGGTDPARTELIVAGNLIATGTEAAEILFASARAPGEHGDWGGVRTEGDSPGQILRFEHCLLEHATTALDLGQRSGATAATLSRCAIRHSLLDGVSVSRPNPSSLRLDILASRITANTRHGIYVSFLHPDAEGSISIRGNSIEGNGFSGMYIELFYGNTNNELIVNNNTFARNINSGIYFESNYTYSTTTHLYIGDNDIFSNATGIFCQANQSEVDAAFVANRVLGNGVGIFCRSASYDEAPALRAFIAGNEVADGAGHGISLEADWDGRLVGSLVNNRVTRNGGSGVRSSWYRAGRGSLETVLAFNTVTANAASGVVCEASQAPTVVYNDIHGNAPYDFVNGSSPVDGSFNHWGAAAAAEMDKGAGRLQNVSSVYDGFDDLSLGVLQYLPPLPAPLSSPAQLLSRIFTPLPAHAIGEGMLVVRGVAYAAAGVERVEVSLDDGVCWHRAESDVHFPGQAMWRFEASGLTPGTYTLRSRVIASSGQAEVSAAAVVVTVERGRPTTVGALTHHETWSGAVAVEGDVIVPEGVTLTLLPGTTLEFPAVLDAAYSGEDPARSELIVHGNLIALGTAALPIRLGAAGSAAEGEGSWGGILASGSLRLRHVTVEHARSGIRHRSEAGSTEVVIDHCLIRHHARNGIDISAAGSASIFVDIGASEIAENGGSGIVLDASGATALLRAAVRGNTIHDNREMGLEGRVGGTYGNPRLAAAIGGNILSSHGQCGIQCVTQGEGWSDLTVDGNVITRSGIGMGLSCASAAPDTVLVISGNTLSDQTHGMRIAAAYTSLAPIIANNVVRHHTGDGIRCALSAAASHPLAPRLSGNQVFNNGARGIHLHCNATAELVGNGIYENGACDLYNDGAAAVDARGNWWGIKTTEVMGSGSHPRNLAAIFDAFDDVTKGPVAYAPWLENHEIPGPPRLLAVTSPTVAATQTLSGIKDPNTAVVCNGSEVVPADTLTSWSFVLPLQEGVTTATLHAVNPWGIASEAAVAEIVRDTTAPRLFASHPASGSVLTQAVTAVEIILLEEGSAIDAAGTLAAAGVWDGQDREVPGEWAVRFNQVVFTPHEPIASEGTYRVVLHPTDAPLGNEGLISFAFTVDHLAPPRLALDAVPNPTRETTVRLRGSKEADTSVWLDGVEIVPWDSLTLWEADLTLAEGSNAHRLSSRDPSGNRSHETLFTIVCDRTPPELVAVEPTAGVWLRERPQRFSIVLRDTTTALALDPTLKSAWCYTATGETVAGVWSAEGSGKLHFTPLLVLPEGTYQVTLSAHDLAGNVASFQFSFHFDETPPAVPSLEHIASLTNRSVEWLTGMKEADSAIEINGVVGVGMDAGTTWSSPVSLLEGENHLEITAVDGAGNRSAPVIVVLRCDRTPPPPILEVTVLPDETGTAATLDWSGYSGHAGGDVARYEVYGGDDGFSDVTRLEPLMTVPAGDPRVHLKDLRRDTLYHFAVVAVDPLGNRVTAVAPVAHMTRDSAPPEEVTGLRVQCEGNGLVLAWDPTADRQKDLAGYRVYLDHETMGVSLGPADTHYEMSGLPPGSRHTATVTAWDWSGNESHGTSLEATTRLDNPADFAVVPYSGKVTLSWSPPGLQGAVSGYRVYVADTPFDSVRGRSPRLTSATANAQVAGLDNEVCYFFAVTAVNRDGCEDPAVRVVAATPTADREGPLLDDPRLDGLPLADGQRVQDVAIVSVAASDPSGVGRVEFRCDGSLIHTVTRATPQYSTPWDTTSLPDGTHRLTISAYDTLGNASTLGFVLEVAGRPPPAPVIRQPVGGSRVTQAQIVLSGTAEPGCEVIPYQRNAFSGSPVAVDRGGNFTTWVTLDPGDNRIQAVARNRAGQSPPSSAVLVTLDTTRPPVPTQLTAETRPGGVIRLNWRPPATGSVKGYHVYRAAQPVRAANEAMKVNGEPLVLTSWDDLPPLDGTYFYGVTASDDQNRESELSPMVASLSDRTPPRAAAIHYVGNGAGSGATSTFGPGVVNVALTVSEPLQAVPFLSLTPQNGVPVAVDLTTISATEYSGWFVIGDDTPAGTARAVFSARDGSGNRGTGIDSGNELMIDSRGPAVVRITTDPAQPIRNDVTQPVTVTVTIGLSEPVRDSGMPQLTYLLSGSGRSPAVIHPLLLVPAGPGEHQSWQGSFVLLADAGRVEVEHFQFAYRGEDGLGNVADRILCENRFQVYQGALPPLDPPYALQGESLPGGRVRLSWSEVSGAAGYVVHRAATDGSAFTPLARVGGVTQWDDDTPDDGHYRYAVASIRSANGQEATSTLSRPVDVVSDSVPPDAPQALALELAGEGMRAAWEPSPGSEPVTYSLYRAGETEILSPIKLEPILSGIAGATAVDSRPSAAAPCYAVSAVDGAGNVSPLSPFSCPHIALLPVSSLHVRQEEDTPPLLTWSYPVDGGESRVTAYKVTVNASEERVVDVPSMVDAAYAGNARHYTVTAIDERGGESPGRSVTLPPLSVFLKEGEILRRGFMNRLEYVVTNHSAARVERIKLSVRLQTEGRSWSGHVSEEFSLDADTCMTVGVAVGGHNDLPDRVDAIVTLGLTSAEGESVQIVRRQSVDVDDGALQVELFNDEFLRGGFGKVWFQVVNHGDEEIELETASGFGAHPSMQIFLSLVDLDGNVLFTLAYRQPLGEQVVTLSNGSTVARIAPGATFTAFPMELPVPAATPRRALVRLTLGAIGFHRGMPGEILIAGPTVRQEITLADTSYFAEILGIEPQVSSGAEDVIIAGRAVERQSGLPLPEAALNLVISLGGFERSHRLYTDTEGAFSFTFRPLPHESGTYKVWAVHPALQDKPVQGRFTIQRVTLRPENVQLQAPKNYPQRVTLQVYAGEGTLVHHLALVLEGAEGGADPLPAGVHLELDAPPASLGPNERVELAMNLWADNNAPESVAFRLRLTSDECGAAPWGHVSVAARFSEARPFLVCSPSHLETGVNLEETALEVLTFDNRGFTDLAGLSLDLVAEDGQPAPPWVKLHAPAVEGTLTVGEKRTVQLSFTPSPADAAEGLHAFTLRAWGANHARVDIPLYVVVTSGTTGQALFKVTDIYTGTVGEHDEIIQGLAGAHIALRHETVPGVAQSLTTDAMGEAHFRDFPAGRYRYRVSAANHLESSGSIWVKPGVTATEEVFLASDLVTVEWQVVETTIQDRYSIALQATYETDVPAAVLGLEPASVHLPDMNAGDVYRGEFNLSNYGLVRADRIAFSLPTSDAGFQIELLSAVPDRLEAKERVVIPYRVVCLSSFNPEAEGGNPGDGCTKKVGCGRVNYEFVCANGRQTSSAAPYCLLYENGECVRPHAPAAGDVGPSGETQVYIWQPPEMAMAAAPSWAPQPLEGVPCWPQGERKEALLDPNVDGLLETLQDVISLVGCSVNHVLREYNDEAVDLMVKVPGGHIGVRRLYYGDAWHWEHTRSRLRFQEDALGRQISAIDKGGVIYQRLSSLMADPVFVHDTYRILALADGFLWEDKFGNWQRFAAGGEMLSFGTPNGVLGQLLYDRDEPGRIEGIADRNGRRVIWFEHHPDGALAAVHDASERRVAYGYSDGHLREVIDLLGNKTTYDYDAGGRLVCSVDAAGRATHVGYNRAGHVSQVVDRQGQGQFYRYDYDRSTGESYVLIRTSAGMVKEVWYDRQGETRRVAVNGRTVRKIVKDGRNLIIIDEKGNSTRKEFDEWHNLTRVIHADGSQAAFTYDHRHQRPLRWTDPRGTVTSCAYDERGNLLRVTEAVGTSAERTMICRYGEAGEVLSKTIAGDEFTESSTTTFRYDADGNVVAIIDPEGNSSEFPGHDPMGNPLAVKDARGNVHRFSYNRMGWCVSETDPVGRSVLHEYDGAGNRTAVTDAAGRRFTFAYDDHNRLARLTAFSGESYGVEYGVHQRPVKSVDPAGRELQFLYDNEGRLLEVSDSTGDETRLEYDLNADSPAVSSQPLRIRRPTSTRHLEYDRRQRLVRVVDTASEGAERTRSWAYDANGNVTRWTDADGNTTTYRYDALNRLIQVVDAVGGVTRRTYDARGNVLAVEDPTGSTTKFAYDRSNRLVKETRPLGQETGYSYDAGGNCTRVVDARGRATAFSYDALNRLVVREHFMAEDPSAPVTTVTFHYDDVGNLVGYDDGKTTAAYRYDALGRRVEETVDYGPFALTSAHSYLANGLKESFTAPDGTVHRYSYDAAGQLLAVSLPGRGDVTYGGHQGGLPSRIALPGGSVLDYAYDGWMRPVSAILTDPAGEELARTLYEHSPGGRILARSSGSERTEYRYDGLGRLVEAAATAKGVEIYAFDAVGNRRSVADNGEAWSYNGNHEILGSTELTYDHDAAGNLTRRRRGEQVEFSYVHNVENRLIRVEDERGQALASYYYDPFGRRLWKEVAGVRTCYHYGDEGLIGEYDGAGRQLKSYGYAPGAGWGAAPVFQMVGDKVYWYPHHHLGTPQQILTSSGRVAWSADYEPFGRVSITHGEIVNNLRFPGHYFDEETGLHYNWQRYYDPATGRYLERDPAREGTNPYVYAANDPVNLTDSQGLCIDPSGVADLANAFIYAARGKWNDATLAALAAIPILGSVGDAGKVLRKGDFSFNIASEILLNSNKIKSGKLARLADELAVTFLGGKYETAILKQDTVLYRAGAKDRPLGQFFSKDIPKSEIQVRIDKAIPPRWPSGSKAPLDTIFEIKIPSGTTVHIGTVAPQGSFFLGGTQQIVIEKPWNIENVEVLRAFPLK
jgi:RHS repeat-associated protein